MKLNYKPIPASYPYSLSIPDEKGKYYPITCMVHFSDRKSISLRVEQDNHVTVRAPYYVTAPQINSFLEDKKDWVAHKVIQILKQKEISQPALTEEQKNQAALLEKQFRKAAHTYIPARVKCYHLLTGGTYQTIAIRNQKSRWGSCSGRGTLSFNYRLMLAPPKVLDYVVVHELCHLTHMNHSKDFWNMVASIMPDYKIHRKWLKDHGEQLTIEYYLFSST